jgi:hypothetical protein
MTYPNMSCESANFGFFYDVDEEAKTVKIEAVGHKEGNRLFIRGKEYAL